MRSIYMLGVSIFVLHWLSALTSLKNVLYISKLTFIPALGFGPGRYSYCSTFRINRKPNSAPDIRTLQMQIYICTFIIIVCIVCNFWQVFIGMILRSADQLGVLMTRKYGRQHSSMIWECLNSLRQSDAYMGHWTGWSLVQVMACCLFGAKALPEKMMVYCRLDPRISFGQIKILIEIQFSFK